MTVNTSSIVVFGSLGVLLLWLGFTTGAKGGDELDTVLVESQGMTEVHNGIVRAGERQVFWNQSDRLHGVPMRRYETRVIDWQVG